MALVPEHHRARQRQKRSFATLDARPDLAQIGKPHIRGCGAGGSQPGGVQHVERRLDRRQVEGEMCALFDDPEKHHLPGQEPLLGARSENRSNTGGFKHDCSRLAGIELHDQALIAPDRNKQAAGIGNALDDPRRVAAAQAGALEARVGVEIRRAHLPSVAHPPAQSQAAIR